MNKKHLLNLIFLMVSISTIVAQSDDISKLNVMHSLKVSSKHFKEPIKYNVTLPEGYSNNKDKSYYVMFDLHPRSHHFLSGLHDWLSHNGEWPWQKTIIITPADYNSEFAKLFGELRSNPKNQTILDYFENDSQLRDILITGGDALMSSDKSLEKAIADNFTSSNLAKGR